MPEGEDVPEIHQWGRYEGVLESERAWDDPVHELEVRVGVTAPSGRTRSVPAFWDGGRQFKVRVCPDERGEWSARVEDGVEDAGLAKWNDRFTCVAYEGENRLYRHGTVGVAPGGHHLQHADGTPFFFLADTAWNGPMQATAEEWEHYLGDRGAKSFSAVMFLPTQYRACEGTPDGRRAYEGRDPIRIDPLFFRHIDAKVDAVNRAGMLAVPLLLHAGRDTALNPGNDLGPGEAATLARYQVARWGAHHVLWDFVAEADFHLDAERWRKLGRAVFGRGGGHPVTVHPHGRDWVLDELGAEPWLDVCGYQSAHGDDDDHWRWILHGPPSRDWRRLPARPVINLEPPYEGHLGRPGGVLFDDFWVRRASLWSLLSVPPAGVGYGSHGVWSWSDGSAPPMAHAKTGTPMPWREALEAPGAAQLGRLAELLAGLDWWRLRPADDVLATQPGERDVRLTALAVRSDEGDVALVYSPSGAELSLDLRALRRPLELHFVDPRSACSSDTVRCEDERWQGRPPGDGDWLVVLDAR
jgi:hypothetical protein